VFSLSNRCFNENKGDHHRGIPMKALVLYVVFVVIGASIAVGIGYLTEIEVSSTASLVVFLALFFANFAMAWIAVIIVMDGSFDDAMGRQAQIEIERAARRRI
jgi:divalent metal cation (Fe/Co/Zn/Cd) transporter